MLLFIGKKQGGELGDGLYGEGHVAVVPEERDDAIGVAGLSFEAEVGEHHLHDT